MTFEEILNQALALLQRQGLVSYRALKRQFGLDDAYLEDLKLEIILVHRVAVDQDNTMLVWTGSQASRSPPVSRPVSPQEREPLSYTPPHLAEKILTSRSALEGERKPVTVLFCDLTNSTPLAERLGPEHMHTLLNHFFELALDVVHRYEGTINQFLGDGFMALFGAPIAHEDHARRAVLAALDLQRTLANHHATLGAPYGVTCTFRMGLNTGLVVVGSIGNNLRMDYSAIGDTTNLAARLQQVAEPGVILVSDATRRLVEGTVQLEAVPPVLVKGKTEPVTPYTVLGTRPQRSPLASRGERALSQFVGRERELATLAELFEHVESGQGQALPYHPILDLLRTNCEITEVDSPAAITEKVRLALHEVGMDVEAAAPYLLQLFGVQAGTERLVGFTPEAIKARTFETLRQMSLHGSQRRPLVCEEVAYESLLTTRRQALHAAAWQALETLYAARLEEAYDRPAYHYARTDNVAKAVAYLTLVAKKAARNSAHVEAIAHLTTGLQLLQTLPATPERSLQELALHIALGASLIATKGAASPEVEQTYARARQLCHYLDDPQQRFPVLRGLWNYSHVRAEHQTAHALGEQLLTLAQKAQDPALLPAAHRALGTTLFYSGVVASAYRHLIQGMALYDPQQQQDSAFLYGEDAGVICHSLAACALWYLGYPDQGLARNHEAMTLAQQSAHPFSLGFALVCATIFHQCRREARAAQERAEADITLATEQGFPFWSASGSMLRGWALAQQGQAREGSEQIQQGLMAYHATGAEVLRPYWLALLAEAYGTMDQPEAGLTVLAEALTLTDKTGERWYEPEIYRLKGELLLQQSPDNHIEAHACFHHALDVARSLQAKSFELRAATSLCRLWQQQGKRAEAYQLLTEVYGGFTEGFDTADLQEAKTLLDELA